MIICLTVPKCFIYTDEIQFLDTVLVKLLYFLQVNSLVALLTPSLSYISARYMPGENKAILMLLWCYI